MNLRESLSTIGFELTQEKIGEGGSAYVHRCTSLEGNSIGLDPSVTLAVKEFKAHLLSSEFSKKRIEQEAELGRKLDIPSIVKSYGIIFQDSDSILLGLEWIEGESLLNWIPKQTHPIPWTKIQDLLLQVLETVKQLHEAGVYHRDIKSENIMLIGDDKIKLMDLGIAEIHNDEFATMHTAMKDFIGSIRFASPQFVRGEDYDALDDVYSIGTVLYELVTGKRVYDEIERKLMLAATIVRQSPTIPELEKEYPKELKILLGGILNQDRARRPSLDELISTLEDPTNSAYITKEQAAQTAKTRGFKVLSVEDDGQSCFADLYGTRSISSNTNYKVLRLGKPVKTSQSETPVIPERFVCVARCKHIQNGVGHFLRIQREWIQDTRSLPYMTSGGRWEYTEQGDGTIKINDIIVQE